jgi:hypothetical protein
MCTRLQWQLLMRSSPSPSRLRGRVFDSTQAEKVPAHTCVRALPPPHLHKVGKGNGLSPDESLFKVGVDHAGSLGGGHALADRPGARLLLTCGGGAEGASSGQRQQGSGSWASGLLRAATTSSINQQPQPSCRRCGSKDGGAAVAAGRKEARARGRGGGGGAPPPPH